LILLVFFLHASLAKANGPTIICKGLVIGIKEYCLIGKRTAELAVSFDMKPVGFGVVKIFLIHDLTSRSGVVYPLDFAFVAL